MRRCARGGCRGRCDPADTEVTIGVDIGTTSVKAIAVDGQGRVRGRAKVPLERAVRITDPDSFEHDAAVAWWEGPRRAVAALGPSASLAAGLGIAACVPSLVALGDHLEPLSPGLLYGDWRGRAAAAGGATGQPARSSRGRSLPELGGKALAWRARLLARPGARRGGTRRRTGHRLLHGHVRLPLVLRRTPLDPGEIARIGITEDQLPIVVTEIGAPAHTSLAWPARTGQEQRRCLRGRGHVARARRCRRDDGADHRWCVTAGRGAHHVRHDPADLGRDARRW